MATDLEVAHALADGAAVVALVDMPATGVRWWATRGGGTFERLAEGSVRRLAVSTTSLVSAVHDALLRAINSQRGGRDI